MTTTPAWTPSPARTAATSLAALTRRLESEQDLTFDDYFQLHRWSIENPASFWESVWDHCNIIGNRGGVTLEDPGTFPGARWFPEARLNFAENLLQRDDDHVALVGLLENGRRQTLTYRDLRMQVAAVAETFREAGLKPGDRVAAFMPNVIETVVAMLAATSLGATWTSCSPDFGLNGVLDRFGQIEPKVLIAADGYYYNGKAINLLDRVSNIADSLKQLELLVMVPILDETQDAARLPNYRTWNDCLSTCAGDLNFEPLSFDHPLYILYSSGTTGKPKCIIHSAGGTLLQHRKEHQLQVDIGREDVFFYFTTCGWMMWNWLVSGLATGATLVLYDGSPFAEEGKVLLDAIDKERITVFGTSAKFLSALQKAGHRPASTHNLGSLKTILSTGSPLLHEQYEYVYGDIKSDVNLVSMSGGTDIVSCFVGGAPALPVYPGEIQAPGLGMAVDIWDDERSSVTGEKGELVCTRPFPSCPLGFWDDASGEKFMSAYFSRFEGVWAQGDYGERTESGGYIIHGRSDAVLNPGGVRIGTAEIYRQVEQLDELQDSVVIGQEFEGDVRVVLFVVLKDNIRLDNSLIEKIQRQIRDNATPRHVPAKVLQVDDIPRTISGKIAELAVRDTVHGKKVKNTSALANPESLSNFMNIKALET